MSRFPIPGEALPQAVLLANLSGLDILDEEREPNWHWLAPKPDWDDPRDDDAYEDEQDVDWGYGEDDAPGNSEQPAQRMEIRVKLLEEGSCILDGLRTATVGTTAFEPTRQELLNRLKMAVTHVRDNRAVEQIPERVVGIAGAVLTEREKRMVLEGIEPEGQRQREILITPLMLPQLGDPVFGRFKQIIKSRLSAFGSRHDK